ncbi:T9SS type A sorting domain-containing protein [bacterium]|nr:T9SS type A sorting domain-containing protein [bacterium]
MRNLILLSAIFVMVSLSFADANLDSVRVQSEYELFFEGKGAIDYPVKSGTPIILDLIHNRQYLTVRQNEILQHKLDVRPTRQAYYLTPDGHFKIHYDTTDVDTHYVHRCGEFFQRVWHVEVDSLEFLHPVHDDTLGGDSLFDVYITDFPWAVYGVTYPDDYEGPSPWHDVSAYVEVNSSYDGFPPNDDPEGSDWGAFKVTCAHEFFHGVQMAYSPDEERWMLEIASVFMEDIVYDYVNDYYNYLPPFFNQPWISIMKFDGSHEYSSCIFFHYFYQRFGMGIIRGIFESMIYEDGLEAIADALDSAGASLDDEFLGFVGWNFLTDSLADDFHYDEAAAYPAMQIQATVSSLPFTYSSSYSSRPHSFGSNYVLVNVPSADAIHISLSGDAGAEWKLGAIVLGDTAQIYEFDTSGTVITDGNSVAIVVLPEGNYLSSSSYNYEITITANMGLLADAGDDDILCWGDTTILGGSPTATGGTSPYSYIWQPSMGLDDSTIANPTASPESSMAYMLMVIDAAGDTAIDTVSVIVDSEIIPPFGEDTVSYLSGTCIDMNAATTGGIPPYTYLWSPAEYFDDSTLPEQTVLADSTRTYYVMITDSLGCSIIDSITVEVINSVSEVKLPIKIGFSAFPNPFNSSVCFDIPENGEIKISDISGKTIFTKKVCSGKYIWKPKNLAGGIYFAEFSNRRFKILYTP